MFRNVFILLLLVWSPAGRIAAQCTAAFSFTLNSDSASFVNLSVAQHAHYYWNFGDGSTSYETDPSHRFPESGSYIVTLYLRDTLSGCHAAKDSLLTVTKASTDPCEPGLAYYYFTSAYYDMLSVNDNSSNCGNYHELVDAGPGMNFGAGNSMYVDSSWMPANFIGRIKYMTDDSINGFVTRRSYFATMPYHYSSAVNYDSCSANFEFSVSYQPSGALLTFHAMDPHQSAYDFMILGMGNPIHLNYDNASFLMPYVYQSDYFPWIIGSYSADSSGCRDTSWQQVLVRNINYVQPPTCAISSQPADQVVIEGNDAYFIAGVDTMTDRQWQMDDGTGFVNLTDAGPFSGVHSDTLVVHNAGMSMNHYRFRCTVLSGLCDCHTTSSAALLTVENGDISVFPVPAHNSLNIIFTDYRYPSDVVIYNAVGQEVMETEVTGQSATLDISALRSGLYTVSVTTNGTRYARKFAKY
ncbi:MAG TPA: T9SS type A sorting domain-containing protein [Bacteroidia bacterium]|nr:T9SS type A sorting domain-containing protein [Bacteroidia bacterium]